MASTKKSKNRKLNITASCDNLATLTRTVEPSICMDDSKQVIKKKPGRKIKIRSQFVIKHEQVSFNATENILGSGNFCHVFKGDFKTKKGETLTVAIKICHEGHAVGAAFEEGRRAKLVMLREAEIMTLLKHENVINLHGVATSHPPIMIVMEYCPGGDLESLLKKGNSNITIGELLLYLLDAVRGMSYVHSKDCVHKDVAARNCLIAADGKIRISDFGLSQIIDKEGPLRDSEETNQIPLRWMGPETLARPRKFSKASDVWSFGVLIFELFNNGVKPFADEALWPIKRIATHIKKAKMPEMPEKTPATMTKIVQRIWTVDPEKRPSMNDIKKEVMATIKEVQIPRKSLFINSIAGVTRDEWNVLQETVDSDNDSKTQETKESDRASCERAVIPPVTPPTPTSTTTSSTSDVTAAALLKFKKRYKKQR